jgi:endogenous inhibitor of DNA gyrase (YacG/DUF329 family)
MEAAADSSSVKAYCLKCKKPVAVENAEKSVTKNKRQRISGDCPECHKKVSQFQKSEKKSEPATEAQKEDLVDHELQKSD